MTWRPLAWVGAATLFIVLASANSGGYRFGVSDQAFYVPALQQQLDPSLFPRDGALLTAQSRLMTSDELMAGVVRWTGIPVSTLAAGVYVLSLGVLLAASAVFARGLGFSWWTVATFELLLTLRHRITKTGANSLEGYMHPRQLAFGLGVAALACVLRRHLLVAASCVMVAGLIHPTTAMWFGLVVATAAWVQRPHWRRPLVAAGLVAVVVALWAVMRGPLVGRLVVMDADWLRVLDEKDYLFPLEWPIDAWAINLAYPVIIWATWRARFSRGLTTVGEAATVWGCLALTAVFLVSVPFTAAHLAFPVQLQITRVFWVMDFVAMAYLAWWMTRRHRTAVALVGLLALGSAARGYYLLEVLQPERQLARIELPAGAWIDAMTWLRSQPADWHVLADPGHAWKYGVSVRVAALKDTVLESIKDSAVALYDRDIAMRVAARTRDLVNYERLTTDRARALDAAYDVDAVVVERERPLDLPVLYRNDAFVIYDLR